MSEVRLIPYRQASSDAGAQGARFDYQQFWAPSIDEDFKPADVLVSWSEEGLYFHASLTDEVMENRATKNHEMLCALGDVFEVFIQDLRTERYVEIHISPENRILVLEFERAGLIRQEGFQWEPCIWRESEIASSTKIFKAEDRWEVDLFVPFKTVALGGASGAGDEWKISMGRYDYSFPNEKPVISSTSCHAVCDFHRLQEWDRVQLASAS